MSDFGEDMNKFLVLFLAAVLLCLPACRKHKPLSAPVAPVEVRSAIENQHMTTHRIGVYDFTEGEVGHCSGTAVGPHAILTAQHCFTDSNKIRLDDEKTTLTITAALVDGQDHVIYVVDHEFTHWAAISERKLVAKEFVHLWGSPGKNTDVFRIGYFQKMDVKEGITFQKFILPTYPGDSGSGIFDENGNVIAVVSMGDNSADSIDFPLSFTQDQLDVIVE
jgi:V8-like Glu-specific endopeptidase